MDAKMFGTFFREMRIKAGKTLRQFCSEGGFDPGNISKMERGLLPAPGHEKLVEYASILGLQEGTDEWYRYYDLASVAHGAIPEYVMDDEALLASLPMVFRTLHNEKLDLERLKRLMDMIREN